MYKKVGIREMILVALCTALLCVSSYIVLPLPFTPIMITAQTIVVNLIGLTLNPIYSLMSIGLFILLGAIGLPVFSGGRGGLGTLFGPTGGFIIGFLFSTLAISYLKGREIKLYRYILVTILVGMPITYIFGVTYMAHILNVNLMEALQLAVIPFIPGDVFKAILSSILALRLNYFLKNQRSRV